MLYLSHKASSEQTPRKEAHQASNDESKLDQNEVYGLYFRMVAQASHGLHKDQAKAFL
jgi:hypothetical protein